MKEYIKPSVQVIDMKVKDNVTAKNGTGYYVSGGKITYYLLEQSTSGNEVVIK